MNQLTDGRIRGALAAVVETARRAVFNWKTVSMGYLLFGLLLWLVWLFLTMREATTTQVVLGLVLCPAMILLLFFVLQSLGLRAMRIGAGPIDKLRQSLGDFWRLLLVTIPLALIVLLVLLGLEQLAGLLGDRIGEAVIGRVGTVFLLLVPLWAIHVWITTVRMGLRQGVRAIRSRLPRVFAPSGLLVYLVIVGITAGLASACFFVRTPVTNEWLELSIFGVRVAIGLTIVYLGWLMTLGALGELTATLDLEELDGRKSADLS